MNNLNKLILFLLTTLLLSSCGGARDFLTNTKKSGGDEFLVEKKEPLTLPPNFDEIPVPISETKETNIELSDEELVNIEKSIDIEVNEAVEFALSAPEPDPSELTKYIWAEN